MGYVRAKWSNLKMTCFISARKGKGKRLMYKVHLDEPTENVFVWVHESQVILDNKPK